MILVSELGVKVVLVGDLSMRGSEKIYNPKYNRYYLKDKSDSVRH